MCQVHIFFVILGIFAAKWGSLAQDAAATGQANLADSGNFASGMNIYRLLKKAILQIVVS